MRLQEKRKQKSFRIVLKTILSVEVNPNSMDEFFVELPSFTFLFRCRHEIAAVDWVNALRLRARSRAKNKTFPHFFSEYIPPDDESALLPVTVSQHNCYIYTGKPLLRNMWVGLLKETSNKVKKQKKIKKQSFMIGRSSSSDFKIKDPYASRCHCKIVIVENVPYLCDMGQSNHGMPLDSTSNYSGTLLNGKPITRWPLAPGDILTVGKAQLLFGISSKLQFTYAKPLDLSSPTNIKSFKKDQDTNFKK